MTNQANPITHADRYAAAAIVALLVLTSVMLLAMFSRTEPHPPLEVGPFAMGPFLAASLAVGAAAYGLVLYGTRCAVAATLLFALTALISYGPQKYVDPAFARIWPAVLIAQASLIVIFAWAVYRLFRQTKRKPGPDV